MKRISIFLGIGFLSFGQCAHAANSNGVQFPAPAAVAADDQAEKKICRSVAVTGSRLPKRHCMTAAQWRDIDEQQAATAREMQRNRLLAKPPVS